MVLLLAVYRASIYDTYVRQTILDFELPFNRQNSPRMKLLPVHSIVDVTTNLVDAEPAHMRHDRVLTENSPPLGTSGVRVVVRVVT